MTAARAAAAWRAACFATIAIIGIGVWVWWWPCFRSHNTTVMLVRHAEKAANPAADPPLTAQGEARAAELVHVAGVAGIDAIYVTTTTRSRQTAQDLAAHLGITPIALSPTDVAGLVSRLRAAHAGQTVFVVGHSNTLPEIIAGLGGAAPQIPETDYDNLFIVTVCCWGRTQVTHLQYGASTPP